MQFISPSLLWALAALAIPILLHLFYFRRFRKVEFSNVRFLKEVKEETQSRSRLRNLLVLALRLLAFTALIFAFAQPFLKGQDDASAKQNVVGIFIDDSFSMSAQASDVTLLEKAKQRAREVIRTYGASTEFQLVTNSLNGASSRLISQEDALAEVDQIKLNPESRNAQTVLNRFAKLSAASESQPPVYIISDFQRSQFDESALEADSSLSVRLVPISAVVERNVSIDSAWLVSPVQLVGEPIELLIALTNHGSEDAEAIRVSAKINGSQQPFGTKTVPAKSTVIDTLRMSAQPGGWSDALIEITDFPIEFDDKYHVAFEVRNRLKALAISDAELNANLNAAFPTGGAFELSSQRSSKVNYSGLADFDLIILDDLASISSGITQALKEYVADGGKLLIFPSKDADVNSYNQLLGSLGLGALGKLETGAQSIGQINTASFVFGDVFERIPRNIRLPTTQVRYQLSSRFGESLLSYRDGSQGIVSQTSGSGSVFLSAAPLDIKSSDLVRNGEIFVPMLYRMALAGANARPLAFTVGKNEIASFTIPAIVDESALRLNGENGESIPTQRKLGRRILLSFGESPGQAGFYKLQLPSDSTIAHLAFNYDRKESPQSFLNAEALAATGLQIFDGNIGGSLENEIESSALGTQWWPWLIGLALLALFLETLVLRFWKPSKRVNAKGGLNSKPEMREPAMPLEV